MNPPASPAKQSSLFIRSFAKAFTVLEAFDTPVQFLGLTEISEITGLDKSTVQRVVHTLHQLGYLERDPDSRRYCLGKALLGLTFSYLRSNPIVARATPTLIDLRRTVQERVGLSLWNHLELIYAVRLQSKRETFFSTLIGRRMPMYCTSGGRAVLSQLPEAEARALLEDCDRTKQTAHTLTDVDDIMRKVGEAARQGYSMNVEEALAGEITISAAVIAAHGRPAGALHVSASLSDWEPDDFERQVAPLVVEAAQAINAR